MSLNVLPGDKFVLEITPNSMKFYKKTKDMQVKEVESFIPLLPTGLGSHMSQREHLEYICKLPNFMDRFGEEEVVNSISMMDYDFQLNQNIDEEDLDF